MKKEDVKIKGVFMKGGFLTKSAVVVLMATCLSFGQNGVLDWIKEFAEGFSTAFTESFNAASHGELNGYQDLTWGMTPEQVKAKGYDIEKLKAQWANDEAAKTTIYDENNVKASIPISNRRFFFFDNKLYKVDSFFEGNDYNNPRNNGNDPERVLRAAYDGLVKKYGKFQDCVTENCVGGDEIEEDAWMSYQKNVNEGLRIDIIKYEYGNGIEYGRPFTISYVGRKIEEQRENFLQGDKTATTSSESELIAPTSLMSLVPLIVILIVPLVAIWLCKDSQPGYNRYGPNPKDVDGYPSSYVGAGYPIIMGNSGNSAAGGTSNAFIFCTKCGKKLPFGSKFCDSCGAPTA